MNQPELQVLVHGASGRMGRALLRLIQEDPGLALAAAVTGSGRHDLAGVAQLAAAQLDSAPSFDVLVDFSLPGGFDRALDLCVRRGRPLVSGTTGMTDDHRRALAAAAASIPVLWAANFSLGVAVLSELVRRAASSLAEWDCDVVESHHVNKLDAPSGTALVLGAAVEEGGGRTPDYASLRAGDIVGEHLVQFTGAGERVELVHRAHDRDIFARGALRAARWLCGQPPGLYTMADMIALPGATAR